ncbi:MAG: 1,4-dihydroxy-2-naphthoate octaprenyltransferase, partial [Pseudomonadota bacterium]
MSDLRSWVKKFEAEGELRIIEEPVDTELEIGHLAYLEMKKAGGGKALLFNNPVNRRLELKYNTPVIVNIFGSARRTEMIFERPLDQIATQMEELIKFKPPTTIAEKIKTFKTFWRFKSVPPKRVSGKGECQEVKHDPIKIAEIMPILKTWSLDAGAFITMGQIYTHSLDGKSFNVGMYRLQLYPDGRLGMHWQIHKDSNSFFSEFQKAGQKMPVSIAIGGDPLYTWCATAPMPHGMFELLLYGFVRGENAKLVKSLTNDLYVPHDADFIIEGFVDPKALRIEGPFGDHTGYYTLEEEYPFLDITAITSKKHPIFAATVVGKPPIEDKYMGYATERLFLPLLKTTCPDLLDYRLPENGVFHNLVLCKIPNVYPAQASQMMHALWGVGQMSFVKHAIFVGEDAPELKNDNALFEYILKRLDFNRLLVSKGVADALDHSGESFGEGGKLGVDACGSVQDGSNLERLSDEALLEKIRGIWREARALKQWGLNTPNPITVLAV